MRIIGGKYRGRKLLDCSHLKLRPTTDSNRESLFNLLSASRKITDTGFDLTKSDVLDVFCGSGAISLEALSRGAKSALLIDKNFQHLRIAKENAAAFGEKNIEFIQADLNFSLPSAKRQFNLIYIDPPYAENIYQSTVEKLLQASWIADQALIVIERAELCKNQNLKLSTNFLPVDSRKYGKTIFDFFFYSREKS